jgi:hypothetical protein
MRELLILLLISASAIWRTTIFTNNAPLCSKHKRTFNNFDNPR